MKSVRKALLTLSCALLIVSLSIFGTIAYLTDTDTVTNTFTVGTVTMTMDETDVKPDGTKDTDARVKENAYHLLPGLTYIKDPVIHVGSGSESCYVFVKVENAIADYEAANDPAEGGYKNIEAQILANGWTALSGVENVYYQLYTKGGDTELEVFEQFKIADMANDVPGWDAISPETTSITVNGYAVQKAGFGSAKEAWNATFAEALRGVEITQGFLYATYVSGKGWTPDDDYMCWYPELKAGDTITVELCKASEYARVVIAKKDDFNYSHYFSSEGPETYTIPQTGNGVVFVHDFSGSYARIWVNSAN